jgi:Na+/H+ antiporter NhaD/arsenite permease-like protein
MNADPVVLGVFLAVYLGMMVGRFPGLALDRTGVALLGAIALIAFGRVSVSEAWQAVDVSTLGLLFGLMVVSSQLRLGGFYGAVTRRIAAAPVTPSALLALLVLTVGGLSAVLANDIVCLAMTPLLIDGCRRRKLNPVPYLLGLAAAANVGSAATLIGNPQNMLAGQTLHLSFAGYLGRAAVPALAGLLVVWGVIRQAYPLDRDEVDSTAPAAEDRPFDRWQTLKGLGVTGACIVLFLVAPWPREAIALTGAGVLLLSRRMASRRMLSLVDWHLLVLFMGLFVVNHALVRSGMLEALVQPRAAGGLDLREPVPLFTATAVLSNLVSNVPAVMLLLPIATHPLAGPILALASTLAGNLFLVGSIANLIVAERASEFGIHLGWSRHARVGIPITMGTLGLAALWLWWTA